MTGPDDGRLFYAATTRNREPILRVLATLVAPGARVLEVASGSGEHAVFLAPRLGVSWWQPSDPEAAARVSIDAWARHEGATTVRPALDLDVLREAPSALVDPRTAAPLAVDVVVCVNMIHISPWAACERLLDLARTVLAPRGLLYLYGPYRRRDLPTAPSNEAFDASLRARDPAWGLRELETVVAAAALRGLGLAEVVEMPANNLSVLLRAPD